MACRARQAPPPCTPMVGYGGAEPSMGSACNGTGGAGSKRTKKKKTSSIYIYIYARVLGRKEQRAVGGRKGMPRWKRRNEAPLLAILFLFFSFQYSSGRRVETFLLQGLEWMGSERLLRRIASGINRRVRG